MFILTAARELPLVRLLVAVFSTAYLSPKILYLGASYLFSLLFLFGWLVVVFFFKTLHITLACFVCLGILFSFVNFLQEKNPTKSDILQFGFT